MNKKRYKKVIINRIVASAFAVAVIFAVVIVIVANANHSTPSNDAEETSADNSTASISLNKDFTVLLDAGHGFSDLGAYSSYTKEYESSYTLPYVMKLKENLEQMGAVVLLTHDGSTYPDEPSILDEAQSSGYLDTWPGVLLDDEEDDNYNKYERVAYSNSVYENTGFDLFISLHFNDSEQDLEGFEVYYDLDNPNASAMEGLCNELQSSVLDADLFEHAYVLGTEDEDSFVVTKYCDYSAILIEGGNMDTRGWMLIRKILHSPSYV